MNNLNKFIQDELSLRRRHYQEDHKLIIEHYNIEQQNIQTYNGRQLLEMLQNADDASETANEKKVFIKLQGNQLIIANNGESFSEGGFSSITTSNFSPKIMLQKKIGQKGLGFRSILSWADEVEINSGGTRLGFSETIAQTFLKDLIKETPSIAEFIKKTSKSELPIATLRVPQLLNGVKNSAVDFDTFITLKLKEDILNDVQAQIYSVINKETLIFLNHIEDIEIESPERKIVFKKTISGNTVTVQCNDLLTESNESKTWHLNKINGEHNSKNYELAIAWNDELNDSENVLFSNFKTQVRFPFPALLHGTFELTQNRNQLENDTTGHNEFLTEKLAELLIDTALKIASHKKEANYFPLKLLNIDFERIDTVLTNFNFKEKLFVKIKESNVFPNVNGKYISFSAEPVFYSEPVAKILQGEDVDDLLKDSDDKEFIKFLESFSIFHYEIKNYLQIISKRKDNNENLAKLVYHALNYPTYKENLTALNFNLLEQPIFLIDNEGNPIEWTSKIFIQPQGEREFALPKSLSIQFVEPELINALLKEFKTESIEILLGKLVPFKVKKYSFSEISETLIQHYNDKGKLNATHVKELHSYLFLLYKNEYKGLKPESISAGVIIPVITEKMKIKSASLVYFGKNYGNNITEQLYSFDKSKLLAEKKLFGLEKVDIALVKEYFSWLRVADLPRYNLKEIKTNKQDPYIEFFLRNIKYPTSKWNWTFKTYTEFEYWLPWNFTISVGEFDDIDKILSSTKIENIFDWIKQDKQLKETLENDREILSQSRLHCYKNTDRTLYKQDMRSYTKWKFSTANFLPVESETLKSAPEKCCLSKTITNEFSPFVEKPKIALAVISEKLQLSEDVIESYLTLIGVHREISSFSIDVLYHMLLSLTTSDKEGRIAKNIYREVISNFNENKLDTSHSTYQKFLKNGKVLCVKGNETGYFSVSEAYYIETKTFGNNILKRFPLVCIDTKRGNKKVERLFGVKSLENISFKIIGEPTIHSLNHQFTEEIYRFKALIYALRMHQDTRHEIKNRLKRLKIVLTNDIKAEFIHDQIPQKFELEQYEFVVTKNKSSFHILIPEADTTIDDLKQNIAFCDSISEIFTTLINTEEYRDFIDGLYSKREVDREPKLLSYLRQDSNDLIIQAKNQLEIIDNIRLSFWGAFSIASAKNINTEIRNEKELSTFLQKKLKLNKDKLDRVSSVETFTQLSDLSNQEFIYQLFLDFKVDYVKFARHFSGLNFTDLFKNSLEDLKIEFRNEFAFHLYNKLKEESILAKEKYFDSLDNYNSIAYFSENGFLSDIKQHLKKYVQEEFSIKLQNHAKNFSFQKLINETIESFAAESIVIPSALKESRKIQALLIFNEIEEIKREIAVFNASVSNSTSNQVRVGGTTIEYDDFQSLALQVLEGLDISKLKLRISKTLPIEERKGKGGKNRNKGKSRNVRFNTKNEEQIGFIAELICYHKLCNKYGEENINWISENAYRAYPEKFMTSEAGKGYDLELKEENGKVRFIEIKGIGNIEDGIRMTKEEIKTALEFPDKYDLLIVENPLSIEPCFRHVKSLFKFRNEETLLSNKKLKVYNDNYIIRFTWDE
ncbi:MAG: DUF3883 domain-containing protein [Ginsengibacter sp.]